jgi:undecaprenyl pyrophosphate synthase
MLQLKHVVRWCRELGIRYVTVYAFSTENFKRSEEEVARLMKLATAQFEALVNVSKHSCQPLVAPARAVLNNCYNSSGRGVQLLDLASACTYHQHRSLTGQTNNAGPCPPATPASLEFG